MIDRRNLSRLLSEVFGGTKDDLESALRKSAWTDDLAERLTGGEESYFADYELVAQLVLAGALRTRNVDLLAELFSVTLSVAFGGHSPRAAKLCCWMVTAVACSLPTERSRVELGGTATEIVGLGQDGLPIANYKAIEGLFASLYAKSPEELVRLLGECDWLGSVEVPERNVHEQSLLCSCLTTAYVRVANYDALTLLFRAVVTKAWERQEGVDETGLLAVLHGLSSELLGELARQGVLEERTDDEHLV